MSTALIRTCADRAKGNILQGVQAIHAGNILEAELCFSLAHQALRNLEALLESAQPPLRHGLEVVETHDEDLPEWMTRRHGEDPDAA